MLLGVILSQAGGADQRKASEPIRLLLGTPTSPTLPPLVNWVMVILVYGLSVKLQSQCCSLAGASSKERVVNVHKRE